MEPNAQTEAEALKILGDRIRALRSEQGLSQVQLADRASISPRYLSEVESGKRNVSFTWLNALARHLAVPLPELLDFEEPQEKAFALRQLHALLAEYPPKQLAFIQRALRMFRART
jgi:transcriptional regulator with XRE-family HTH domain